MAYEKFLEQKKRYVETNYLSGNYNYFFAVYQEKRVRNFQLSLM